VTMARVDDSGSTPIFGTIVTGPDGFFAFPLLETGRYWLRAERDGYTYGQRELGVIRERSTATDDIYLTPLDPAMTPCDTAGCSHVSSDGLLRLEIPPGAILPGQAISVTATNFERVFFLPSGSLPPGTQETYAFNLSGASEITFTQPITVQLRNYRGFDPGTRIPLGYWNQATLQWEHAGTGIVDESGDWVVMHVTHFSMYDCNDPVVGARLDSSIEDMTEEDAPCCADAPGSLINIRSGHLRESLPHLPAVEVLGEQVAPKLIYNSNRANPQAIIDVSLSLDFDPLNIRIKNYIGFELFVEGQKTDTFTFAAPLDGNGEVGRYRYLWDGRNAQGERLPPGVYEYAVRLSFNYRGEYCYALNGVFGNPPDCINGATGRGIDGFRDFWARGTVVLSGSEPGFGAGWVLDGHQTVHEDQGGRILVGDGDELAEYYFDVADNLAGLGQYSTEQPRVAGPASAIAVPPPPSGGTAVSGTITADTTWSPAGSPYKITGGSLTVADGVTLTIEPGVEVLFEQHRNLFVAGALSAIGTATNPITFTLFKDAEIETFQAYTLTNSVLGTLLTLSAASVDGSGATWLAGSAAVDGGALTLDRLPAGGAPWQSVPLPAELDGSQAHDMVHSAGGETWLATDAGLGRLAAGGASVTLYDTSNSGIVSDHAQALAFDGDGDLWIATGAGASQFTPSTEPWSS
ncbi:MAG TPA: hypothetical protein VER55_12640, partial [Ardenticatenaceae bacterium]|nr:hypothetical protein [Ardenticatenaceae bacterium]